MGSCSLQVCPSWRICDAAPAVEPERAKGQRDFMLEEARWLATDFAQVPVLHGSPKRTEGSCLGGSAGEGLAAQFQSYKSGHQAKQHAQ